MILQLQLLKNPKDILFKFVEKFLSYNQDKLFLPKSHHILIMQEILLNLKEIKHYSKFLVKKSLIFKKITSYYKSFKFLFNA